MHGAGRVDRFTMLSTDWFLYGGNIGLKKD